MAYYNRSDGPGRYYQPGMFGGMRFFPPVIKFLLFGNLAIWLLTDVFLAPFLIGGVPLSNFIISWFALWPVGTEFWPWQLFTYMFLHGGFWHIFLNMFGIWMFGMELENMWGSRRFLVFYLLCGVGGGLAHMLTAPLLGQGAPTIGASGALFGILIAFAMFFPDRPILLYFLLPIKAKYFIGFYIAIELFHGVMGTSDGVAHFAHLGGAAVGWLYVLGLRGVLPFHSWWSNARGQFKNPFGQPHRVYRRDETIRDAKFYDIKSGKPLDENEVTQETIDAILDKISTGGYQSLTEDEKRILMEASRKIH